MSLLNQLEAMMGQSAGATSSGQAGGQAGGATPGAMGGDSTALINAAKQLLTNSQSGGLGGLLAQLEQGGLGDAVKSWVSTGPNQAVSGDALHQALGSETMAKIAQQIGVSPEMASRGLAMVLPHLVNHVTPDGSVPANNNSVASALEGLLAKMGGQPA